MNTVHPLFTYFGVNRCFLFTNLHIWFKKSKFYSCSTLDKIEYLWLMSSLPYRRVSGYIVTLVLQHFRPSVLPSYDTFNLCNIRPTTAVGRMYILFCQPDLCRNCKILSVVDKVTMRISLFPLHTNL